MLAKTLRRHQTDAESRLWYFLRARRSEGLKFRRQEVIGSYIVDFVCLEAMLIVEADGGQHAVRSAEDADRTACLESMGYTVLRYWNHDILSDTRSVLDDIRRNLV